MSDEDWKIALSPEGVDFCRSVETVNAEYFEDLRALRNIASELLVVQSLYRICAFAGEAMDCDRVSRHLEEVNLQLEMLRVRINRHA